MDSLVGADISNYRVVAKLGSGGMGVVYKAVDRKLDRNVALKFLPPDPGITGGRARLIQEAKAASKLDHPNVGTIHAIEETPDGRPFLVMACYEGETLLSRIRRSPLPPAQAAEIAMQAARGLAEAHAKGIVHRDIKPSNILITTQGIVKVLDFGIAKLAASDTVTGTGYALGTATYMSPEQATGGAFDQRTDIWSLGAVLYEMLTGEPPFTGDSVPAILYAIVHEPLRSLEGLPSRVQAVVCRMLAKDPAERYQTMREVVNELQSLVPATQDTPTATVSLDRPGRSGRKRNAVSSVALWRGARRMLRRRAVAGITAASLLLAVALAFALVSRKAASASQRVAVLPFSNVGSDPAGTALCDGLMETLTSRLSNLEGAERSLWVVPASEVRRRKLSDPGEARKVIGAGLIVSGSVQRSGTGARLIVNLIDAADLRQINSVVLDDRNGDFAALQDEAVSQLAQLLNARTARDSGIRAAGPGTPAAYESYLKAVGHAKRYDKPGNLDTAIQLYKDATNKDPRFALAYAGLGEAYWLKYRLETDSKWLDAARENCRRAAEINAELAPVHVILGRIHDGTGQHGLALQEFQRALQLDTKSADALQGLGRAYEGLGRLEEAEKTFKRAIALRPEYWEGYNALGAFYFGHERYRDAVTQFRRVVQLTEDNAAGYSNLGGALLAAGEPGEARKSFLKSIQVHPNFPAYMNLAKLHFAAGDYGEAARLYEQALTLNDRDYRVWGSLGLSYARGGAPIAKILACYRKASHIAEDSLKEQPDDANLLAQVAGYYAALGTPDKALLRIEQALALAPRDNEVLVEAGDVYELLGMRKVALKWIRRALAQGYPVDQIKRDPDFAKLTGDPEFKATMR